MQEQRKISVVVPCFNVTAYLDECMEHLLGQTIGIENLEIILVDDASTDNGATRKLVLQYEKEYPDTIIVVLLEQNLRQGGARNTGISYASGEYLVFCDADDWMKLDALEHIYNIAKRCDADVVEYRMQKVFYDTDLSLLSMEEGKDSYWIELDNEDMKKMFYKTSAENCSLGCMRKAYRLQMIQENQIQFTPYLICGEPSFTMPVRLYEKRHCFLNELLYFYRMTPGSTVHGNWEGRRLDNLHVWEILMDEIRERGFLQKYYEEMSYMFFQWAFVLSIRMLIQKEYALMVEEMQLLVGAVLGRFPDIRENVYIKEDKSVFMAVMLKILDLEITEESLSVIEEVIKKYM